MNYGDIDENGYKLVPGGHPSEKPRHNTRVPEPTNTPEPEKLVGRMDIYDGGEAKPRKGLLDDTPPAEQLTERELLHKWLGGQSLEFTEKFGREAVLDMLRVIERRRPNG